MKEKTQKSILIVSSQAHGPKFINSHFNVALRGKNADSAFLMSSLVGGHLQCPSNLCFGLTCHSPQKARRLTWW